MSELPEEVRSRPLHSLAIPGSHNSLSYTLQKPGCPAGTAPDLSGPLAQLCRWAPRLARPLVARWAVTQALDVTGQLEAGVRYLDLRAEQRGNALHVVHGLVGPPLAPLLADVRRFLDARPGEFIVLDFQHVYGLDAAGFARLAALLRETFGEALLPRGEAAPSLAACAAAGRRVLAVCRAQGDFAALWPAAGHLWDGTALWSPWADTQRAERLFLMLQRNIDRAARMEPPCLHVHQCVFTPQRRHVLLRAGGSLRRLADDCNAATAGWLRSQSVRDGLNIVMTDFVGADGDAIPEQVVRKNYSS